MSPLKKVERLFALKKLRRGENHPEKAEMAIQNITETAPARSIWANALPDEILLYIFQILATAMPKGEFHQCIMTCKNWHRIGSTLFYREVLFRAGYHSTGTYGWSFRGNAQYLRATTNLHLEHIQSFTMTFNFEPPSGAGRFEITAILKGMINLKTLSLKANNPHPVFQICRYHMVSVVKSVPESVRNFELDVLNNDIPKDQELCYAIGNLMTQLHHVRLNLSLCMAIFGRKNFPNLRTVLLLGDDPLLYRYMLHRKDNDACCEDRALRHARPIESTNIILEHLLESGAFPSIEEFVIISSKPLERLEARASRLREYDLLTYHYPRVIQVWRWDFKLSQFELVAYSTDFADPDHYSGHEFMYIVRHYRHPHPGGKARWRTDVNGVRHPHNCPGAY